MNCHFTFHVESEPDDGIGDERRLDQIHHSRELAIDRHSTLEAHLRAFRHYLPDGNVMSSDRIHHDTGAAARAPALG